MPGWSLWNSSRACVGHRREPLGPPILVHQLHRLGGGARRPLRRGRTRLERETGAGSSGELEELPAGYVPTWSHPPRILSPGDAGSQTRMRTSHEADLRTPRADRAAAAPRWPPTRDRCVHRSDHSGRHDRRDRPDSSRLSCRVTLGRPAGPPPTPATSSPTTRRRACARCGRRRRPRRGRGSRARRSCRVER